MLAVPAEGQATDEGLQSSTVGANDDADTEGAAMDEALAKQGRELFLETAPACSICHVLSEAGSTARVGPSLDDLQPNAHQVRNALLSGPGAMPEYGERLSEEQIDILSRYVAHAAGGAAQVPRR